MRPLNLKSLSVAAIAAAALSLSACGNKTASLRGGETEGLLVNVGPLRYAVQISRQLNPAAIAEDRTFVSNIAPADRGLRPGQLWFAVFVRIENPTKQAHRPTTGFSIRDTQGNVFRPVQIGPGNPVAYSTAPIPPEGVAPPPNSIAAQLGSINGYELLFKLPRDTLDNRPLTLRIKSFFPAEEAEEILDV